MIKVKCTFKGCQYKLEKPHWEHIVNTLHKQGGHAGSNICPICSNKTLVFDFTNEIKPKG